MNRLFRTASPLKIRDEWRLNNGTGTNQIATEDEAKSKLGYTGAIVSKRGITKSRAIAFGAASTPINSYKNEQLVKYSDIFPPDGIAVDLGLSVKWATVNIGGKVETDYGNYYQWGATDIYENTWKDDNYYKGDTDLDQAHDIAHIKLGGKWRMPTDREYDELIQLPSTWTTINGVNGRKFTASNGNYIFLPAAGYYDSGSSSNVGSGGGYWSSSMFGSYRARCLYFGSGYVDLYGYYRNLGFSIRAVLEN